MTGYELAGTPARTAAETAALRWVGGGAMKRTPAEEIVGFLSFSGAPYSTSAIEKFSGREWDRILRWMDDGGLAFYFLQKLKDANALQILPAAVRGRLEGNFAANQLRMDDMSRRFDAINQRFNAAGVRYTVIKGFSLVPEFCRYASLRHQGDFDYLVNEQDLAAARRMLLEAGYKTKESRSTKESIFISSGKEPSRSAEQYSAHAPHAVELHTDIWDSALHGVAPLPRLLAVEQSATKHWNGISFPAQSDEDAFLLQVLHACRHMFTQWIRMSCWFEIGYFLNRRASDESLWSSVERRVGDSEVLREFVVIVSELAALVFAAPLPRLVRAWGARIRSGPQIWIENYGRKWAFCELPVYQFSLLPKTKLVLFLQQQYRSPRPFATGGEQRPPASRISRMASSIRRNPSLVLDRSWWKRQRLIRRGAFYALAELRYVCEIPRWRWRNRTARSAGISLESQPPQTQKAP